MFAKINHVAMVSSNYAMLGKFYETLFGMTCAPDASPRSAITVGDGYVGLNINPRRPGRAGGLDHLASRSRTQRPCSSAWRASIRG